MSLEWNWLQKQFGMADGSAYARLLDAQSEVHDLVAREVTQNSWDAAQRHRAELASSVGEVAAANQKFRLIYDFKEVEGGEKKRILAALNAQDLVDLLNEHGHGPLKFEKGKTILDRMASQDPLSLLYINDYGATGLRGDPVGGGLSQSDFFRAFGQIGGNDREEGGGSFGFGKSAFIKSSRIRCVIAYSSFFAQPGDPVTRRLWGFVYWPSFGINNVGVGQLGVLQRDSNIASAPAVDQVADAMAESFGFQVRTANTYEDCGTSLLIVDHVLEPQMLMASLELWWWPAMETHRSTFDISVRTSKEVLRPQPLLNDKVKPYIRAFEIAQDPNAQLKDGEFKPVWKAIRDQGVAPGSLAVVRTESNLEEGNDSGLFAHVALIRNPRMVVNYEGYSGSSPNTEIKGVYIASNDADNYLRKTEPSSHDRWDINIGESSGPEWEKTGTIVKSIKSRIKREIQTIQQSLRQQPKRAQVPLSWANELFAQLFSEPTKAGKKASVEGLSKKKKKLRHALLYDSTLTARDRRSAGNGRIVVQETWSIILADEVTDDVPAIVDFAAWALADGKEAKASDRLSVEGLVLPAGFQQTDEGVLGTLEPGKTYEFSFSTVPYEQDWNVRTDVSIKAQTSDEAQGQVEEEQ